MIITNDCKCCAERRLIKDLEKEATKKGVPHSQFGWWVHRKYGDIVIHRMRKDGVLGCSLPCVLCKKAMDRRGLQWVAFDGERWVHSRQSVNLPPSVPTSRQRKFIFSKKTS